MTPICYCSIRYFPWSSISLKRLHTLFQQRANKFISSCAKLLFVHRFNLHTQSCSRHLLFTSRQIESSREDDVEQKPRRLHAGEGTGCGEECESCFDRPNTTTTCGPMQAWAMQQCNVRKCKGTKPSCTVEIVHCMPHFNEMQISKPR